MKSLKKAKVKKNILYYLSEITIVVFGIFFAIQLNNLNDNRKNRIEGNKSIKRILTDLKYEKFFLDFSLKELQKSKKYLVNILYNNNRKNLDSLYFHVGTPFTHYKMNSEYINLKSSGKLNLITDDQLRQKLVYYYESTYAFYEILSKEHRQFIKENTDTYFRENIPRDTINLVNAKLAKTKLKDVKLTNLINEQISFCKHINKYVETKNIDSLLNSIERYLN